VGVGDGPGVSLGPGVAVGVQVAGRVGLGVSMMVGAEVGRFTAIWFGPNGLTMKIAA
jgi:hypothetical protein